jgi:hypothetical protein
LAIQQLLYDAGYASAPTVLRNLVDGHQVLLGDLPLIKDQILLFAACGDPIEEHPEGAL